MANEVARRKAFIADIEVEVTRLMASAKLSTKLSAYINGSLKGFCEGGIQDGWPPEFKDGDLRLDKIEEFEVSNLSYHNFVEAKILVYNAMRLIDDEIGIFHKTLVRVDDGTEYYNIWEDVQYTCKPRHAIELPLSTIPTSPEGSFQEPALLCEPGDKIGLFFEERRKFFSYVQHFRLWRSSPPFARGFNEEKCPVGPLFLLPECFYLSPESYTKSHYTG